jgi:hypothetical protein
MSKIYNEITIDMNPESSSFEEVVHEDSFEYSGDMVLLQPHVPGHPDYSQEEQGSGWDFFNQPPPQEEDPWWQTPEQQPYGGQDPGSGTEFGAGMISYGDVGDVISQAMSEIGWGGESEIWDELEVYIRGIMDWDESDIDSTQLRRKIRDTMPPHMLDKVKEQAAIGKRDLSFKAIGQKGRTITEGLGTERKKLKSIAGVSGVRAPGAGGFKGMGALQEKGYQDIYGLGLEREAAKQQYGADIYALEQDWETDFGDWLKDLL